VLNNRAIVYSDSDDCRSTYRIEELPIGARAMVARAFEELKERLIDLDEELGLKFLAEEEIEVADIKSALRRQTIAGRIVPVAGGSAFKNKGIQALLDAVVDCLPSPLDVPPAQGHDVDDHSKLIEAIPSDHVKSCCLAFKLWSDKYVGKLVFFRVLFRNDQPWRSASKSAHWQEGARRSAHSNPGQRAPRYRGGLLRGHCRYGWGEERHHRGSLCDPDFPILLEPPSFPEPVISMALEVKTTADQDKMATALQRLRDEDPTFMVRTDDDTGQTIISGMGELHLEVIRDRMLREFKVGTNAGKPQIALSGDADEGGRGRGQAN